MRQIIEYLCSHRENNSAKCEVLTGAIHEHCITGAINITLLFLLLSQIYLDRIYPVAKANLGAFLCERVSMCMCVSVRLWRMHISRYILERKGEE